MYGTLIFVVCIISFLSLIAWMTLVIQSALEEKERES